MRCLGMEGGLVYSPPPVEKKKKERVREKRRKELWRGKKREEASVREGNFVGQPRKAEREEGGWQTCAKKGTKGERRGERAKLLFRLNKRVLLLLVFVRPSVESFLLPSSNNGPPSNLPARSVWTSSFSPSTQRGGKGTRPTTRVEEEGKGEEIRNY